MVRQIPIVTGKQPELPRFNIGKCPYSVPFYFELPNGDDQTVALQPALTWDGILGACRSLGSMAPVFSI